MSVVSQLMLSYPQKVTPTYATWNPSDKASSIALSSGNLTATTGSSAGQVRANIGKSSGKWAWEYRCTTIPANGLTVGISQATSSVNNWTGQDANSIGWWAADGNTYFNNGLDQFAGAYTTSSVLRLELNMDAGSLALFVDATSLGTVFTGLTGVWYPSIGQYSSSTAVVTANFGASAFAHTITAGFNSGLY